MKNVLTGWFGIPGAPSRYSTKVHVVHKATKKPICGTVVGNNQSFQFCATGAYRGYIECEKCLSMTNKED